MRIVGRMFALCALLFTGACTSPATTPVSTQTPVFGVTILPTQQSTPTIKVDSRTPTPPRATTPTDIKKTPTPGAGVVSPTVAPVASVTLTPRASGVQIISPVVFNAIRARTSVYFAVNALNPGGLKKVELNINDQVVASEDARGEPEYNLVYGWSTELNGDYRVQAQATDAAGNVMRSDVVVQQVRGGLDVAGNGTEAIADIGSMVAIPAATFRMGSDDGADEEKPVHDVHVSAFQIDRYEVTVGQFRAFVAETKYRTSAEMANEPVTRTWQIDNDPKRWEHPVRFVSWFDADKYCHTLGKALPTEAQWEYAARGTDFRRYPWGNDFDATKVPGGDTAPVGFFTLGASPFGLYDIAGNVWEWTDDWFDPLYYRASDVNDPHPVKKSDQKSIRGGGFNSIPSDLRVTRRIHNFPTTYHQDVGFRCAK